MSTLIEEAAMETSAELVFEAGKYYRTRDGLKVIIYAVYPDQCADQVHGAVFNEYGYMGCVNWNLKGKRYTSLVDEYDLVAAWIDPPEVDWSKFPEYMIALAMDNDGEWHGFSDTPIANDSDRAWYSSVSGVHDLYRTFELYDNDYPEFSGDWRDSLVIRPGYEEVVS